jgi:tetratricopeptide (TPR) repeat protein
MGSLTVRHRPARGISGPLFFALAACTGSDQRPEVETPGDARATIAREAEVESELVAFADAHRDHAEYAASALLRAAVLARDAGAPDRERSYLERIVRDYPHSSSIGTALYLRGLAASDAGDIAGAITDLWAIVCANRPSDDDWSAESCRPLEVSPRVAFGAWLALGQIAFDDGELDRAEAAFTAALALAPEGEAREVVRYKLAWTFYRRARYSDAVARFAEVAERAPALRAEAIEYIAICLSENDWNGDEQRDALVGLARPEARALLARDDLAGPLLATLVRTYVELAECGQALETRNALLGRDPSATVSLSPCDETLRISNPR